MKKHDIVGCAWYCFAIIYILIVIIAMPYIFIGIDKNDYDESFVQIPTNNILLILEGGPIPEKTKIAVWFAEKKIIRLFIAISLFIIISLAEVKFKNTLFKKIAYLLTCWIGLLILFVNIYGIAALIL